jgi:Flp pilus assembly protein CpaB
VIDANKVIGLLSLVSLPAGSTITASRIGRPQTVALAVVLKRGMRAVSIGIDRVKAVGGLIQPGDRVDVIAVPPRAGDETPQGSTIVSGALVLASGMQMESTSQPSPPPGMQEAQNLTTVTLAVTPAQADLLASADVNATLRLALRSPLDPIGAARTEQFRLPRAQVAKLPVVPVVPVPPPAAPVFVAAPPAATPVAPPARARLTPRRSGVEVIEEQTAPQSAGP